ncbi:MAG: hypothetical protein IK031_03885 [Bacteroidales bacterium]|nr:hypothetical protein [Bacteroidales bacterium]
MRKIVLLSLLTILGLGLLSSCKNKEDLSLPSGFNEPAEEVRVYDKKDAAYVAEEPTETAIVFSAETPEDLLPEVGSIIQMPISDKTPYGFLGRVSSIYEDGEYKVVTETVPLEEAYPNLSIDVNLGKVTHFYGLVDENGEQVEFRIVDKEEDTVGEFMDGGIAAQGWNKKVVRDNDDLDVGSEFDWEKKKLCIHLPQSWVKVFTKENINVDGVLELSFEGSSFKLDNTDGDAKYLDIDLQTRLTAGVKVTGHIKSFNPNDSGGRKEWKTPSITFTGVIPVGPIAIPVTIPICLQAALTGDLSTSVELRYNKYWRYHRVYKNGTWSVPVTEAPPVEKTSPWVITEFDAAGKFSVGPDVEFNIGLFTNKFGIGLELFPNGYIKAEANVSTLDVFAFNPLAEVGVGLEWRVYCRAKIFGKKMDAFSMDLPELTLYKRTVKLFPEVSNFSALGSASSAELTWQADSYCLLELLGVKTGATLFSPEGTEETFYPSPTSTDRKGVRYYYYTKEGLKAGSTYYAAPTISWLRWKWHGDKVPIETEAAYRIMWRCENREDIWNLDISLSSTTTTLNMPFEAATYNSGWTKRLLVATFDPKTYRLTGRVETDFYSDPDDRRIDGFTADLSKDDTGYITNSKILDNGACYTQIRFVKLVNGQPKSMKRMPVYRDRCVLGEHIGD